MKGIGADFTDHAQRAAFLAIGADQQHRRRSQYPMVAHQGAIIFRIVGHIEALAVTALRNLLENALRHSPVDNSVSLTLEATAHTISFTVTDRGPGLSSAELTQATQRFWRRRSGRGSGLGLSIVVAIAERFDGSLALQHNPGGGLQARLTLPANGRDADGGG